MARALGLLRVLCEADGPLSLTELRERTGVRRTERTLRRDLEALVRAGFCEALRGAWVATSLARGDEVLALFSAARLSPLPPSTRLDAALRRAGARAARGMGRSEGSGGKKGPGLEVTPGIVPRAPPRTFAVLETVRSRLELRRCLAIAYPRGPAGESDERRVIEPLRLELRPGAATLVAYCRERRAARRFRVDRIRVAALLEEPVTVAPDDAAEEETFLGFAGAARDVALTVDPSARRWFEERELHPTQRVECRPDGSARVTLRVGGVPALAKVLAPFGGELRVEEPEELRAELAALHRRGWERQGGGG